MEVITIRYAANKTTSEVLTHENNLRIGDRCVITTDGGVELGIVIGGGPVKSLNLAFEKTHKVLRKATERDLYLYSKKQDREEFAYRLYRQRIRGRKLPMKLSRVEYIFDGSRMIFYFTANRRVDFRDLVKDLARKLRTRVEMRQIGARDEAKLIGGQGCCGLGQNCSSTFLKELKSVSVKAVKQQKLAMSQGRLSGMCGRLKCCLNYEVERDCNGGNCGPGS